MIEGPGKKDTHATKNDNKLLGSESRLEKEMGNK